VSFGSSDIALEVCEFAGGVATSPSALLREVTMGGRKQTFQRQVAAPSAMAPQPDGIAELYSGSGCVDFATFSPETLEMHLTASQALLGKKNPSARSSRLRQAAKRATFPWINRQIITAAETNNMECLLHVVGTLVNEMNLVNLSTALHRLAKMSAGDSDAHAVLAGHPTLAALLPAMDAALIRAEMGSSEPRCQATSNSIWSLATMQVAYRPLLQTVATFSERHIRDFKPFELSTVLWAFAKLGAVDHDALAVSARLFELSSAHIIENASQFSFRCLVMTAWAYANARQSDDVLFQCIAEHILPMVQMANCQELANAAWSFSTAGVYHEELFAEFAQRALLNISDFKPQELSNLLWSYAVVGNFHLALFECGAQEAQRLDLQPQHLSNLLWAYSRVQPHHRITRSALLALLPRCLQLMWAFKPQELASVLLAAAKCFRCSKSRQQATSKAFGSEASNSLPAEVSDFFTAAVPVAMAHLPNFSNQSLANTASAFVALQIGTDTDLFPAIARESYSRAESLEPTALLLLLRNLPGAPHGVWVHGAVRLLFATAASRISEFQDSERQILSRICCSLLNLPRDSSIANEELHSMCQCLAERGSWQLTGHLDEEEEDLINAEHTGTCQVGLGSFCGTQVEPAAHKLISAPTPWTKACIGDGDEDSTTDSQEAGSDPQEVGSQTGESTCSDNGAAGSSAGSHSREFNAPAVKLRVHKTFLELDEDEDSSEDTDAPVLQPMGPALDILPQEVCKDKLAAFRADYRRFRVGRATGARGELHRNCTERCTA